MPLFLEVKNWSNSFWTARSESQMLSNAFEESEANGYMMANSEL